MFSSADLLALIERHAPRQFSGYAVGVSGGGDSAALLVAAAQLREAGAIEALRALHVDHGLQASAALFRREAAALCERFNVELTILAPRDSARADRWPQANEVPAGESVEAFARRMRYESIGSELRANECLLTAHHAEDQAETFLLQALRGAGPMGLSAMPALRRLAAGWHWRPLLGVPREELRAFAHSHGVAACIDPMNADERFDRSYLRAKVWPALGARWPSAARTLSRATEHAAAMQRQVDEYAKADWRRIQDGETLSLTGLRTLSERRQLGAMRVWIVAQGPSTGPISAQGARMPSSTRLHEAVRQLLTARADRAPDIDCGDFHLRRYRDRIYFCKAPAYDPEAPQLRQATTLSWNWQLTRQIALGGARGSLTIVPRNGGLDSRRLPDVLEVRSRCGGEHLRIARGGRTQALQRLLQARGVPPWLRAAIPLIVMDEHLLGVADYWLNASYVASEGAAGIGFVWRHTLGLD